MLAQPLATNPNLDTTGQYCNVGQSGPVWFLAGSFGAAVERTCTIPPGKALLFPVVTNAYIGFPWDPADTPKMARDQAVAGVETVKHYGAEIDGVSLQGLDTYRLFHGDSNALPVFNAIVPADGLLDPPGTYGPCANDGVYLMLAPLRPGTHDIHFTATEFGVDVTYHLNVKP